MTSMSQPNGAVDVRTVNGRWSEKLWSFTLTYDNDSSGEPGVFLSGTALVGNVMLDVKKPMTIVRVLFKCEGNLRIEDMKRELFKETRILQGQEKGRRTTKKTAPGRYKYPIRVQLPEDLPTTIFQTNACKVKYDCTVTLVRKSSEDDITIVRPFVVHQKNPKLLQMVTTHQNPETGSHSSNGITVESTVNKGGFFPGQTLSITGTLNNSTGSSKKVKVGAELIRTVKGFGEASMVLFSYPKHRQYVTTVASRWTDFLKVPKNGSTPFSHEISMAHMEPSSQTDILEIEYKVKVITVAKGVLSDDAPRVTSFPLYLSPTLSSLAYEPAPPFSSAQNILAHRESQASLPPMGAGSPTHSQLGLQYQASQSSLGVGAPPLSPPVSVLRYEEPGAAPIYPQLPSAPEEDEFDLPPAYEEATR